MIERQITRGTKIVLQPENASVDLTQPFFAINWFNTRAMWLYNLYNLIAAHRVFNVDARIFLKGRVTRNIAWISRSGAASVADRELSVRRELPRSIGRPFFSGYQRTENDRGARFLVRT